MVSRRNKYNRKTSKKETRQSKKGTRQSKKGTRQSKKGMLKYGGNCKKPNPFIGKPWSVNNIGNHLQISEYGIPVGGIRPFPGNKTVSLRHGGGLASFVPQPILNRYRKGAYDVTNVYNRVKGIRLGASPLPFRQDKLQI